MSGRVKRCTKCGDARGHLLLLDSQVPPASPQAGRPQGVEPAGEGNAASPVGESQETEVAG